MDSLSEPAVGERLGVRVRGAVQGVGFRPFVYRLAQRLALTGWVCNDGAGVAIEVQGARVAELVAALRAELPRLARLDAVEIERLPPATETGFEIRASVGGRVETAIGPDVAICDACLAELFDPADRHYLYPFLNCTDCGPRYTLTRALPYDRRHTSMAGFALCADCAAELHDPANRRFHAQPIACPACGPRLDTSVGEIMARMAKGEIVAVKGLGGFHLACDARNAAAVARLRQAKERDDKPFAVMVLNRASAERVATLDPVSADLLEDPARPIVIVPRLDPGLAEALAPGLPSLGLMLPYTPLHYLMFHEALGRPDGLNWLAQACEVALVMTSANPGGEPLVVDNDEARRRLATIADAIVTHDRAIVVRADDSVMRVIGGRPSFIRRARGQVPRAIRLSRSGPSVLAVGPYLKNTVTLTRGDEAFVSQHVGDLDGPEAIRFFEETVDHLQRIVAVSPEIVAHDLHPDFPSTRYAEALGLPTVAVQHHHAHVAAILAEHGEDGPALGLALDGFGLGADGGSWGGELLQVEGGELIRLGHLAALAQPGGDAAAREPWRMAAAVLQALGRGDEIPRRFADRPGAKVIAQMLEKGVNCPPTSGAGRWFDAAAGLLGLRPVQSYEGQAPMELEGLVTAPEILPGAWHIADGVLDLLPLLAALIDREPVAGANLFHGTLVAALADWIEQAAAATGLRTVALAGGCFLNAVLSEGLARALAARGLTPLLAHALPPNDGGVSLGQAWVALAPARQQAR